MGCALCNHAPLSITDKRWRADLGRSRPMTTTDQLETSDLVLLSSTSLFVTLTGTKYARTQVNHASRRPIIRHCWPSIGTRSYMFETGERQHIFFMCIGCIRLYRRANDFYLLHQNEWSRVKCTARLASSSILDSWTISLSVCKRHRLLYARACGQDGDQLG
jgi:hypothetical protein